MPNDDTNPAIHPHKAPNLRATMRVITPAKIYAVDIPSNSYSLNDIDIRKNNKSADNLKKSKLNFSFSLLPLPENTFTELSKICDSVISQSKSPDKPKTKIGGMSIIEMPKRILVILKPESNTSYAAAMKPPINDADIFRMRFSENQLKYTFSVSSSLSVPETIMRRKTTITAIIE